MKTFRSAAQETYHIKENIFHYKNKAYKFQIVQHIIWVQRNTKPVYKMQHGEKKTSKIID